MKKISIIALSILLACSFSSCKNYAEKKLKRQMKPFAKSYLKTDRVVGYDSLTIDCVDTITEMGYARMNVEFLNQMEASYQEQYEQAVRADKSQTVEYISLYLNEIGRTKADFEDLIDNGDLQTTGVVLFMVTGTFEKDGEGQQFMFLVNPDKKSIHNLDPFGDNLLYKDEE